MKKVISYANLYNTLEELYKQMKTDNYSSHYLETIKTTQKALLALELLNLSRLSKSS